jgi:hypothetical protein
MKLILLTKRTNIFNYLNKIHKKFKKKLLLLNYNILSRLEIKLNYKFKKKKSVLK